ncbi:MAG: hypothetical protein ACLQRM_13775 [Acidimicrobiales bacterium]
MTPSSEEPRADGSRGPLEKGLTDQSPSYSDGALARRRARRDALHSLERLRDLITMYDAGSIELDEVAFGAGLLGAKLGKLACSGVLAA